MSKAILIIDMPNNCAECPFLGRDIDCIPEEYCQVNEREIINVEENPKCCPLKEVPQKYEPVSMNFEIGWNACIDEILKEHEKDHKIPKYGNNSLLKENLSIIKKKEINT